jgi:hypothetical protein
MNLRILAAITLSFAAPCFSPALVHADSVSISVQASAGALGAGNGYPVLCNQSSATSGTSTCLSQFAGSEALADLSTGLLGGDSAVSVPIPFTGAALSQSSLDYNFNGLRGGVLRFDLTTDGTLLLEEFVPPCSNTPDCTDGSIAQLGTSGQFAAGTPNVQGGSLATLSGSTENLVIDTPIVNGQAELFLELDTAAVCNNPECIAFADFIHTVAITGAEEFDANGNVIPNATIVSESGFNPNATTNVPEPASVAMLAFGLVAIGLKRKRASRATMETRVWV